MEPCLLNKLVYSRDTYKYFGNGGYVNIGNDIAGTEYDVAHVKWGGSWRMPTLDQMLELLDNCTLVRTEYNREFGTLITGPNGTTIFLPEGSSWEGYKDYWSSSLLPASNMVFFAYRIECNSYRWNLSLDEIYYGNVVRPIINPEEPNVDPAYPVAEAIDLGLPSGTKWASWNVGASSPEEYGGSYAWGETEVKADYDWSTYIFYDDLSKTCHHLGDDIAGTRYDVAHVKWGGSWRMPSEGQWVELMENCTKIKTSQNGVTGYLITGPNGATIFMPWDYINYSSNDYWSSSSSSYGDYCAWVPSLYLWEYNYYFCNEFTRQTGCLVRAVCP